MFLHGKVKCSSRTCSFMGTHVPMLGRFSVFTMLPHVPSWELMFHWWGTLS